MSDSDETLNAKALEMTEGKWDSLPADSEAQLDYPVELLKTAHFMDEVRVRIEVWLPDGTHFEYEETTPIQDDSQVDEFAQALAMTETVSETMIARVQRIQL